MKKFDMCNYCGADWRYIGEEDKGVRLMSLCKNVSDVIVPYSRKTYIKIGAYQSSTRLNNRKVY